MSAIWIRSAIDSMAITVFAILAKRKTKDLQQAAVSEQPVMLKTVIQNELDKNILPLIIADNKQNNRK